MAPGARSKFGDSVLEPEVFRKQMYCIEESTCGIVGAFGSPSDSAPRELCPLAPLFMPWLLRPLFEIFEYELKCK